MSRCDEQIFLMEHLVVESVRIFKVRTLLEEDSFTAVSKLSSKCLLGEMVQSVACL